ncbi:MAG: exodeoxyribonuclease VII large subunit [Bacteroidales bacterium]|nr:exodeoxyribonuclease VII large subunit [Bacteroidales bacterium]
MLASDKITLFELNQKVKETLSQSFQTNYWIVAEVSEVKENSSGHCYLELIQKDELQDYPKAKARATIWAYTYRMLKPYFETTTGRSISSGIKILVLAEVVFHEVFGYSLNITDIEPNYTIGDIEQKRREAIEKLVVEGVFDMNKGLELQVPPKRVAVISSSSAAGLQDFINQLHTNNYGYKIEHTLFTAIMQGSSAEESIINALNKINEQYYNFDVVVIIRGGGSQADLACFDSYWLAAHVAQFPLPIITGIGHEKDISVVDLVAHTKLKTPTAVADFIVSKFIEAESILHDLKDRLEFIIEENLTTEKLQFERRLSSITPRIFQEISKGEINIERLYRKYSYSLNQLILNERSKTTKAAKTFELLSLMKIAKSYNNINQFKSFLNNYSLRYLVNQNNLLEIIHKTNTSSDPSNILKRGYSITLHNGKILKDSKLVKKGETITTKLNKGELNSNVI